MRQVSARDEAPPTRSWQDVGQDSEANRDWIIVPCSTDELRGWLHDADAQVLMANAWIQHQLESRVVHPVAGCSATHVALDHRPALQVIPRVCFTLASKRLNKKELKLRCRVRREVRDLCHVDPGECGAEIAECHPKRAIVEVVMLKACLELGSHVHGVSVAESASPLSFPMRVAYLMNDKQ